MKHLFVIAIALVASLLLNAQNEKYVGAMKKNIADLDSAMQQGRMPELANNFERIGEAEKTQWLPYYYASYCQVMNAFMEQDKSKTDGIANKAEELIKKAEEINGKENSETCVIKSMIASSRLMVDPQNRWMQYGQVASANINKAKELDPSNPRPVFLEGQSKFYTPEQFGGGKAQAKELFQKALDMFNQFKPSSELHPAWGKTATNYFLSQSN
ncbi:MAG TPA: hypothetical protein VEV87_09005 [Chitinophagaceae bacterium]|nr:hypothetical protein [Chitinophagaceae bacterium]